MNTSEAVINIIREYADKADIKLSDRLREDLGFDSIDMIDASLCVEDDFDVVIDDQDIASLRTVGGLISFIEEHSGVLQTASATFTRGIDDDGDEFAFENSAPRHDSDFGI